MAEQPKPARPQRTPRAAAAQHLVYASPPWENADAASLRAMRDGRATPVEQKRALDWIMYRASNYLDEPFRPGGEDGRRETEFALGRAFVGRQIAKLLNIDLAKVRGHDGEQP